MAKTKGIYRDLEVDKIINPTEYAEYYALDESDRQIPDVGKVKRLIGSNGAIQLTKTQADLLEDGVGTGNWYLEWLDNTNQPIEDEDVMPLAVTVNNITLPINQLDRSFTPPRLYGFANNDTQTINVTVSKNIVTEALTVPFANITGNLIDNPLLYNFVNQITQLKYTNLTQNI